MDKDKLKKLTGLRVKELRKSKGLTQEQLAELADIGERNLSKIECGKNFVSAETLAKFATIFNVPPNEIFRFDHLEDKNVLKNIIIEKIKNEEVDICTLYKLIKVI